MKRSVVVKRLDHEAAAGCPTCGASPAAFSLFQGISTRYEGSCGESTTKKRRARRFFLVFSSFPSFLRGWFSSFHGVATRHEGYSEEVGRTKVRPAHGRTNGLWEL